MRILVVTSALVGSLLAVALLTSGPRWIVAGHGYLYSLLPSVRLQHSELHGSQRTSQVDQRFHPHRVTFIHRVTTATTTQLKFSSTGRSTTATTTRLVFQMTLTQPQTSAKPPRVVTTAPTSAQAVIPVAVCLAGNIRTFLYDKVQEGLINNFHHEGFEYFLSFEASVGNASYPLKPYVRNSTFGTWPPRLGYGPPCQRGKTIMHKFLLLYVMRFEHCSTMIKAEEKKRRFQYTYIIRTRPDIWFKNPMPAVDGMMKWRNGKDVAMCDDVFAISNRSLLPVVLEYPRQAYGECHDAERWAWSCGVSLEKATKDVTKGKVPCAPMMMSNWYGKTTSEEMAKNKLVLKDIPKCTMWLYREPSNKRMSCPPTTCR